MLYVQFKGADNFEKSKTEVIFLPRSSMEMTNKFLEDTVYFFFLIPPNLKGIFD